MAAFSTFRYLTIMPFFYLILCIKTSTADPNCSFSFDNFGEDSNFESQLALYGDAKVVHGGNTIQVSGSGVYSAGRIMFRKPIKLVEVETHPANVMSFSTHFVFSISPEYKNGDGLVFVVVPLGLPLNVFNKNTSFGPLGERRLRFFGVEFDVFMDGKYGDVNDNHVGVDVGSLVSVKVSNVSSIKLVLSSGEKLQAWIDYEAVSKRLEIRLSRLGDMRPVDPLLSCLIDLGQMWKEEEVVVGLSSSSGNSSQKFNVYSWSFKLRPLPRWMHSQPLDPNSWIEKTEAVPTQKRSNCLLTFLSALIFGTGCGALGAFIMFSVWTIFWNRRPVVPEEYAIHPGEFDCKQLKVVVDKALEDGK